MRYLTGYTGSNGLALVGPQTRSFVTDFRYVEQAAEEVDPTYDRRRGQQDLLERDPGRRCPTGELRLGFDDAHVTVRQHAGCASCCPTGSSWSAAGGLVERLRAVKEPGEIERIRAATALADEAFAAAARAGAWPGAPSASWPRRSSARWPSGAPSGRRSTRSSPPARTARCPHASPRDVEIRRGELVVIDWGAEVDGYCSDCTRTVATGEPGDRGPRGLRARAARPSWPASRPSGPGPAAARSTPSPAR